MSRSLAGRQAAAAAPPTRIMMGAVTVPVGGPPARVRHLIKADADARGGGGEQQRGIVPAHNESARRVYGWAPGSPNPPAGDSESSGLTESP